MDDHGCYSSFLKIGAANLIGVKVTWRLTLSPLRPGSPYGGESDERKVRFIFHTIESKQKCVVCWGSYFDTGLTDGTLDTGVSWATSLSLDSGIAAVSFGSLVSKGENVSEGMSERWDSICVCVCVCVESSLFDLCSLLGREAPSSSHSSPCNTVMHRKWQEARVDAIEKHESPQITVSPIRWAFLPPCTQNVSGETKVKQGVSSVVHVFVVCASSCLFVSLRYHRLDDAVDGVGVDLDLPFAQYHSRQICSVDHLWRVGNLPQPRFIHIFGRRHHK